MNTLFRRHSWITSFSAFIICCIRQSRLRACIIAAGACCLLGSASAADVISTLDGSVVLSEDFESGTLDPRITVQVIGTFSASPGIKSISNFGSAKAFGFGRSTCPASCFSNYVTTLRIALPAPTFVSSINLKEMELFDNWGSKGYVLIDGVFLTGHMDFGREPSNDRHADTTFRSRSFPIDRTVNTIELRVEDITNLSEIYIDDLVIASTQGPTPTPTPTCAPPPPDMVSWWPGDGNANDIQDGNSGTLQNGATFAAGMVGQAFNFDGINDFVVVPNSDNLNFAPSSSLTMEAWVFRTSPAPTQHIMGKRSGCGSDFNWYQMAFAPGPVLPPEAVPLNTWTYLAIAFETGTGLTRTYVNGSLYSTVTFSIGANTAPFEIGTAGTCQGFGGLVDEVAIYNRALSAPEILAIYNAGSAGKCKPTATPTPTPIYVSGTISYCSGPVPDPVPNVTLTLTGSGIGSTLSDGSGHYQFTALAAGGSYTVTPSKAALLPTSAGIDTFDVMAAQRHFLTVAPIPPGCGRTAADVNGDNRIDTADVVAIQRFFVGRPFGFGNVGNYKFTPANRVYMMLGTDQTGQDYDTLVLGDIVGPFVHRQSGPLQDTAGGGESADEVPATVATVSLPEVAVAQLRTPSRVQASESNFIAAVRTSVIDVNSKLVGFQGDFSFDERVVTFQSEPVQKAGLTADNWNVSGNVLPGVGPIRTLRISAYSNDFTPLSGSGTLFELRMRTVSDSALRIPNSAFSLVWAAPPNQFIFIDADLNTRRPGNAAPGSVTGARKR